MKHSKKTRTEVLSELSHLRHRLVNLMKADREREHENETFEEFRYVLEELRATEEELRLQTEELLRSRQLIELERQRYQELFEFAPDGYLLTDPSGIIREANQSASALLGVPSDSLRGNSLHLFFTEKERFRDLLKGVGRFSKLKDYEVRLQPTERDSFYASITAAALRDPRGKVLSVRWLVRDISRRKQIEKALRHERDKAQKYLAIAGAMIVCINPSQQVDLINKRGCEILGFEEKEILGKNWFDNFIPEMIREDSKVRFRKHLSQYLENPEWQHESPVLTRSEEERIIEWHNALVTEEAGQILGVLSSGLDITDRKQAEEKLRLQKEFSEHLINSSADGILAFDREFRYTVWNPAMERISGLSKEETLRKNAFDLFPSLKETGRDKCFRDALDGKTTVSKDRAYVVPTTRKLGFFDAEYSPLLDSSGEIIGGLAIIRDVTDRKVVEEALRESEARYRRLSESLEATVEKKVAELEQAQSLASIGQVVSIVSHEIRNPLQNIRMAIEALRKVMGEDREKLEILKEVDYGVNTLNNIVGELLEYSKPVKLKYTSVLIRDIVIQALMLSSSKLRDIEVVLELEQEDRRIFADPDKLLRVLVNLIANAAEAMPGGGELRIGSGLYKGNEMGLLKLWVKDTGHGIEPENIGRIQEPFFTTKPSGTGLGFPICKKIIEAHYGSMEIRSGVNAGTTVEIILPASR